MGHQLASEIAQIKPAENILVDQLENGRCLLFCDCLDETRQRLGPGKAESSGNLLFSNSIPAEGDHLVECRLSIAQTARRCSGNFTQCLIGGIYLFEVGDLTKPLKYLFGWNLAKLELLTAREDRLRYLVQFCGRHNKNNMTGRLFDGLQEGIEGSIREHVNLVDNKYLEAISGRSKGDIVDNHVAYITYAGIGGCIDLEYVNRVSGGNLQA